MENFFDRYKEADKPQETTEIFELLDDMVEEWHCGASDVSLQEYLGFSSTEYEAFVSSSVYVLDMLKDRNLLK